MRFKVFNLDYIEIFLQKVYYNEHIYCQLIWKLKKIFKTAIGYWT